MRPSLSARFLVVAQHQVARPVERVRRPGAVDDLHVQAGHLDGGLTADPRFLVFDMRHQLLQHFEFFAAGQRDLVEAGVCIRCRRGRSAPSPPPLFAFFMQSTVGAPHAGLAVRASSPKLAHAANAGPCSVLRILMTPPPPLARANTSVARSSAQSTCHPRWSSSAVHFHSLLGLAPRVPEAP